MLHYALVFLVIALIAAVFGFGGIASGAMGIAKILFWACSRKKARSELIAHRDALLTH